MLRLINKFFAELVQCGCGTWYNPSYGNCPVCCPKVAE